MNTQDILFELKKLAEKFGKFPTHSDLVKLKEFTIRNAIITSGIKISWFAEQLGYTPKQKPKNYWTEHTIAQECSKVCEQLGGWPTSKQWHDQFGYLIVAITKSGKNSKYFQKLLNVHHLAETPSKVCEQCQQKFTPPIAKNSSRQRFCCNECNVDYFRLRQNARIAANRNKEKTCPICSKVFIPPKTLKQVYCERNCYIKFRKKLDKQVRRCLEAIDTNKSTTSEVILGYSPQQLLEHLKVHPKWEELQGTDWQLDHVFPIAAFVKKGVKDIQLICALDNLQPLSRDENLAKGDKYDLAEFEAWLNEKQVNI